MNSKHSILIQNGIRIYPEVKNRKFYVAIEDDYNLLYKKKAIGNIDHTTKTINKALEQMVEYVYDKIKHKL